MKTIYIIVIILFSVVSLSSYSQKVKRQLVDTNSSHHPTSDSIYPILKYMRLADVVVTGKVISARSYWNQDSLLILTDYTIQTTKKYIGQPLSVFTITVEGGEVGDTRLDVSNEMRLKINREYLMLLSYSDGMLSSVKGDLGIFEINTLCQEDRVLLQQVQAIIGREKESNDNEK